MGTIIMLNGLNKLLIFIALITFSALGQCAIYKWVDKDGKTHFSDKPPKDKQIKATKQSLDNMNVIHMPRPLKVKRLSQQECQQAVDNFSKNYQNHRKIIEKELARGDINDMQFSEKLGQVEALKQQITLENCHKADPKLNTLLHCMAKNPNTQICSS